jgi:DNA-binding transcriptional MerR regulator
MNENLKKALRVLQNRGLVGSTTDSELARLAGLSRPTIIKSKTEIKTYLNSAPLPSNSDEDYVDRKLISTYVDIALTSGASGRHFAQVTGAVAGFVLRHETNLINNIQTPKKIVRVGQAYLNVMTQIEARKDGKGTPINSQNKDVKYLLTELNNSTLVEALFSRSNTYRTDAYSKSWKLTHKASLLNQSIKDRTIKLIESYNATQGKFTLLPLHIPPSICSGKSVNKVPGTNLPIEARFFNLPIHQLVTLSVQSFLQIMKIAQPSILPSLITIPLKNLATVDPSKGSTYNIFTRLRSSERKALGYHNYDISGGLQIISFNILYQFSHHKYATFDDLHGEYPLIFDYGVDPDAKKALREDVGKDLGVTVEEVKKLLTAYANGSQKQVGNSSKLQEFYEQSDQLRREVLSTIAIHKAGLLSSAISQSKKSFPEDMDWQSIEKEGKGEDARDKASVFFFIWTHFEKKIRDAMLSVVNDGIRVHDAIYSKHKVPFRLFEQAVLKKTGFDVKIGS